MNVFHNSLAGLRRKDLSQNIATIECCNIFSNKLYGFQSKNSILSLAYLHDAFHKGIQLVVFRFGSFSNTCLALFPIEFY